MKNYRIFSLAVLYITIFYKSTQNKAAHYPHIASFRDLDSQHDDPDYPKYLFNCSFYHYRAILQILSKSANSLLSNGRIADLAVNIVIQIATKIWSRSFFCNGSLHKISLQSVLGRVDSFDPLLPYLEKNK